MRRDFNLKKTVFLKIIVIISQKLIIKFLFSSPDIFSMYSV